MDRRNPEMIEVDVVVAVPFFSSRHSSERNGFFGAAAQFLHRVCPTANGIKPDRKAQVALENGLSEAANEQNQMRPRLIALLAKTLRAWIPPGNEGPADL